MQFSSALKLEKQEFLCYNIFNCWGIEIAELQNNNYKKETVQERNLQNTKATNSRREVSAYELRFDYKRRERIFPLRFFIVYGNNSDGNLHRLNEPKNRRFI